MSTSLDAFIDAYSAGLDPSPLPTDPVVLTSVLNTQLAKKITAAGGDATAASSKVTGVPAPAVVLSLGDRFGALGADIRDFCKWDGMSDDAYGFQAASAWIKNTGNSVNLVPGTGCTSQTWDIGDGTTSSLSTYSNPHIIGAGGGMSDGQFGPPRFKSRIKWIGGTDKITPVIRLNGPIHSSHLRSLYIDCNGAAGRGLEAIHSVNAMFDDIMVVGHRGRGIYAHSLETLFTGITQITFYNTFRNCHVQSPGYQTAVGLFLGGVGGASNNLFFGGTFQQGGDDSADDGGHCIILDSVDQNSFYGTFTHYGALGTSAKSKGVFGLCSMGNPLFPWGNTFINCPLVMGVGGYWGNYGNMAMPWLDLDGEGNPPPNWTCITADGRQFFGDTKTYTPIIRSATTTLTAGNPLGRFKPRGKFVDCQVDFTLTGGSGTAAVIIPFPPQVRAIASGTCIGVDLSTGTPVFGRWDVNDTQVFLTKADNSYPGALGHRYSINFTVETA